MTNNIAVRKEVATVRQTLEKMLPQLQMALPNHIRPERFIRVAMTTIQVTPKLLECDRTSLFSALMTAAQLGLECDGVLGQAYLVPFKKRVQFIPGYKGLITLARNSGEVTSIQAQAVHQNDEFYFQFGLDERLDHTPARGDRGEITHFYAIAKFRDGGYHWDVITREEVDQIRDNSYGYQAAKRYAKNGVINSPWVTHYEEMGRKTVIRRISKYLPLDVQKAAYLAASYDTGKFTAMKDDGTIQIEGNSFDIPALEDDTKTDDEDINMADNGEGSSQLDEFAADDEQNQMEQ